VVDFLVPDGFAMLERADTYLGRVTFISGEGKHCGKTTFMNRAASLVRQAERGTKAQGLLIMTVGYDGESRDFLSGARKPSVPVFKGDYYITAERFLRSGGSCPEIVDVLSGSSVLGRLVLVRASRDGTAALVGPEGNAGVGWVLSRVLDSGLASTALVDGAINRITQASSRPDAQLVYALQVDQVGAAKAASHVKRMATLVSLSLDDGLSEDVYRLSDALTAETAARLPKDALVVSVADFTSVFLGGSELNAFLRERRLLVRRPIRFAGFSVVCRGIQDSAFAQMVGRSAALLSFNPYEAHEEGAA